MAKRLNTLMDATSQAFVGRAGIELHRAERYRVFVSLTILDLEFARRYAGDRFDTVLRDLKDRIASHIRVCDYADLITDSSLAILLPETSRQGAEVTSRRLAELIRTRLGEITGESVKEIVPVEIVSYPDTAGAKTLAGYLESLAEKRVN